MTRHTIHALMSLALLTVACEGTTTVNNAPPEMAAELPTDETTETAERTDSDSETNAELEPDEIIDAEVTYYRDVQPILQAHCTDCHWSGGIGPFALTDFEEVAPLANLVSNAMSSREMPPWPPADDCQEIEHALSVPQAEIDIIAKWAELGAPAGDPADRVDAEQGEGLTMRSVDLTVDIGADYKPEAPDGGPDDHRCFTIDPGVDETRFVNMLQTRPSNLEIAHHMLLFAVTPDQADAIRDLEAQDSDPGYDCFSGAGVPEANLIGGWVPGAPPMQYPEGAGIELPAGSLLVAQMHYNTLNDSEGTDRTEIDISFIDGEAQTELVLLPLANYGFEVPVGERQTVTRTMRAPADVTLYGIAPHMHYFGESIRVNVSNGDDSMCLIDIPRWDFNWQGFYGYSDPVKIAAGSEITLECDFDNRLESQPAGVDSPKPLQWGDGTYDEMCLAYFVVERP